MTDTRRAVADAPPFGLLQGASLFLDFDGTLVELAARPDAVVIGARLPALMARLHARLEGRLALVSGRPAGQLAAYFTGLPLVVSGSHGVEVHRPGRPAADAPPPAWIAEAAHEAEAIRARHPRMLIEVKPFGIGLHYREAPEAEAACRALAKALLTPDRHLQPGKMVYEVRQAGGDKGSAVRAFMAEPAMAGTRPVFIGDDLNDEPGFRAAADLGGAGILVGPARDTAATYRLDTVTATLDWLDAETEEIA